MEQIYALYYEWEDQRQYFYVGRTGRNPQIRKNEHRLKSRTGREDVYQFIREQCQPNGIDTWDMELLETEPNGTPEDCEDFWVVLMIRAGYDLKNMKHGDLHRISLEILSRERGEFQTVDEFVHFRERVAREQYERSQALKKSVLEETPSPRGDLQMILEQARLRYEITNTGQRDRALKKAARARAQAIEHNEWLASQRLFENGKK